MIKDSNVRWCYFLVHLLTEIICFTLLTYHFNKLFLAFSLAFLYDLLAFVPQGIIGDLYKRLHFDCGSIGVMLMGLAVLLKQFAIISLVLLCFGNCFIHIAGALATTKCSNGRLADVATFVGGGSFGVVIGQNYNFGTGYLFLMLAVMEIIIYLSNPNWQNKTEPVFDLVKEEYSLETIILTAVVITAVRSFIGYAIPISWKKEVWHSFLLFFVMGAGKVAGGYFADYFGAKKTGVYSTLLAIPFLLAGKDQMLISVIGVFMFSLTMSICFGMIISVIRDNAGFSFGFVTFGLFIGVLPQLFFGSFSLLVNNILVVVLSVLCSIGLAKTLK